MSLKPLEPGDSVRVKYIARTGRTRKTMNIQWEQHKDGNYYAYRNGHELIGSVRLTNSRQIAECHLTLTAQKFENLTEAKQWVVDQADSVL